MSTSMPAGPHPGPVVIVGAGHAGFQLAIFLRQNAYPGEITLIGDEPELPYQRPPLSKAALAEGAAIESLWHRPADFYARERIELVMGQEVAAIDRPARHLVLASGARQPYGALVLATGARNRRLAVPGADLDGVVYLRTAAEAKALQSLLSSVRNLVVIGAGFIGLEVAAVARGRGISVTVLEREGRVLGRAVSPAMSELVEGVHRGLGTEFVFGDEVRQVIGNKEVEAVETKGGRRLPADLVLVGIGVVPNAEIAAAAGLAVANGIVVDQGLVTSDPTIFALGDCAVHPNAFAGGMVRLESVQNATDQARLLAKRLMGQEVGPYHAVPWFWSDQGPLKLQIAGLTTGHDLVVSQARSSPCSGSVFCFRDGRLLGVESANRPGDHMAARQLLAQAIPLTPQDISDGFDLKAHVKAALAPSPSPALAPTPAA